MFTVVQQVSSQPSVSLSLSYSFQLMQPSLSKMPASQISLSSAVVHEPSSDEGLLSTSNNDLKEDVEGDVPAGNHSEGTSPCFDAVKEGQESSEHVPLSMLSPSEGASVDPGVQDSMVMKERVSCVCVCVHVCVRACVCACGIAHTT